MFYLLGLAIFLTGIISSVLLLTGDLTNFLDIPSLALIIVPLAAVLTATQNFKIFAAGFKAAVLPKADISDDMRAKAASLFRFLSKTTVAIGIIMFLASSIVMLMGLDFDAPKAVYYFGVAVAAGLVVPLYGLILIAAVFEPIVIILKKRGDKDRK